MSMSFEQLREQMMELSLQERLDLAHELFESVDGADLDDDPEEVQAAWVEEINQRVDDLDSGQVAVIPSKEVFAKARAISSAAAQVRARAGAEPCA